jgi:peptide deformylase
MKLIQAPNSWLNYKVKPFNFDVQDAGYISQEMTEMMFDSHGIGLSANQVEIDAQIFVMKSYTTNKKHITFINPSIQMVSEDIKLGTEGCLSYPGLYIKIKRPTVVLANYFDIEGRECTITLKDVDARCFLHEYDHLQGITFTDRVSKLKLDRARKKQQKRLKNG